MHANGPSPPAPLWRWAQRMERGVSKGKRSDNERGTHGERGTATTVSNPRMTAGRRIGEGMVQDVRLPIRVTPRASKDELCGWRGKRMAVKVTAAPVEGAANEAVIKLLAKALGVRGGDVTIVSGHSSRDKVAAISGCSRKELLERLKKALEQ